MQSRIQGGMDLMVHVRSMYYIRRIRTLPQTMGSVGQVADGRGSDLPRGIDCRAERICAAASARRVT